jgi:Leucine-rich repeat (LRR) protein
MLLSLFTLTIEANSKSLTCESIEDKTATCVKLRKSCLMKKTTEIDEHGFSMASPQDESIERITFSYNKKVQFLPENIDKVFPNLAVYDASSCAIKEISTPNFINLSKLSIISLDGNLIERIERGTFEGLIGLTEIYLSKYYRNFLIFLDSLLFLLRLQQNTNDSSTFVQWAQQFATTGLVRQRMHFGGFKRARKSWRICSKNFWYNLLKDF